MKKAVIPIISVITFVGILDTHLLIPIIALYVSQFGIGTGMVGIIVGLYSVVNTPANLWFGRIVDRYGARKPLIVGLVGDAIAMFLYVVCRAPIHFILVRLLHGTSGAMIGPATMSLMSSRGEQERQGRTMAYYGMALAAASLVGYPVSGIVASRLGYDVVFYIGGGLLVGGILLVMLLPSSRPAATMQPAIPAGEVWRSAVQMFRRNGLTGPYVTILAQYVSLGGMVTLLPLYALSFGLEAMHTGIILAAFSVMFVIIQLPVGRLVDRTGPTGLINAGLVLGVGVSVVLPFCGTFATLAAVMAVYGIAFGLIFPSVAASVTRRTSTDERGLGMGIFHALLTAGVAIGAPVLGGIGQAVGLRWGLGIISVVFVLALIVNIITGRRTSSP